MTGPFMLPDASDAHLLRCRRSADRDVLGRLVVALEREAAGPASAGADPLLERDVLNLARVGRRFQNQVDGTAASMIRAYQDLRPIAFPPNARASPPPLHKDANPNRRRSRDWRATSSAGPCARRLADRGRRDRPLDIPRSHPPDAPRDQKVRETLVPQQHLGGRPPPR